MIFQPIVPPSLLLILGGIFFLLGAAFLIRARASILRKVLTALRLVLILALAGAVLMRPMLEDTALQTEVLNTDVLFVVDRTISMWARDYKGTSPRMDGVREDCRQILDGLPGASFGVIWFDNTARVMAPYTQDAETVWDVLDMISMPDSDYAKGSSLNTAYAETAHMLDLSRRKEGRQSVVIFISDGEITDGSALMSFADLRPYVDGGAVLGYGTEKGGEMNDGNGFTVWNSNYERAVSRIDENNLGVVYMHRNGDSTLDDLIGEIVDNSRLTSGEREAVVYDDIYWMFAVPLAILILMEMVGLLFWR